MQLSERKIQEIEQKLSKLGALAADVFDSATALREAVRSIETKLLCIQKEMEDIYITLEEPLILVAGDKTPDKGVQMGGKATPSPK